MSKPTSKKRILKTATSGVLIASSFSTLVAPISAANFLDIENNVHKNAILELFERGILNGFGDGTFKPEMPITREQAAKIIASTLNLELRNVKNPNFTDVSTDSLYFPFIAALADQQIISGYGDQTFKPEQTITRGEISKMIAIGFNLTSDVGHPFTDVKENSDFYDYISALFNQGVTLGTSKTTFSPSNHVTRGEVASFVMRAEKNVKSTTTISGIITAVSTNVITVNGVNYEFETSSFLENTANRASLLNAEIVFKTTENTITHIEKLHLTHTAKELDGKNLMIDELSIPSTFKNLSGVKSNQLIVQENQKTAALTNTHAVQKSELIITNSQISELISLTNTLNLTNNNSVITYLNALATRTLLLKGLFSSILIAANTTISGSATIDLIDGPDSSNANITFDENLVVKAIQRLNEVFTLEQALKLYGYNQTQANDGSNNTPPSGDSVGNLPSTGDESDSDLLSSGDELGADLPSTDGESDADLPSTGDESDAELPSTGGESVSELPSTDGESDAELPSTGGESDAELPSTGDESDADLPSTGNEPDSELPSTGNEPDSELPSTGGESDAELPSTGDEFIDINGETAVNLEENKITIAGQTYTMSENQTAVVSSYLEDITSITMSTDENNNPIIESLSLQANETFDGAGLQDVIEVTLIGDVARVQNLGTKKVSITSTADQLSFENVQADITAMGSFSEISGAAGQTLTIKSTRPNVLVNNVQSADIIIADAPIRPIAMRTLVASLNPFAAVTNLLSTTTMTVTFTDGDYSGQTLTVQRKDTKIDLQGKPFSKVTINNNGTELSSSGVSAINVAVANGVTNLSLNAPINDLTIDLQQAIAISGSGKIIGNLTITGPATGTNGWLDLINVTVSKITLNGLELLDRTHAIFKKHTDTKMFTSTLVREKFGHYKIETSLGTGESLKYVLLPEDAVINTTAVPSNAIEYTAGTSLIPFADTPKVVVYKLNNGNFTGYSIANVPDHAPVTLMDGSTINSFKIKTRFSDNVTPAAALQYILIFSNGELVYSNNTVPGNWEKEDGLNTYAFSAPDLKLDGKRQIYVAKNLVYGVDITVSSHPEEYIKILKTIANYSMSDGRKNPEMIYDMLKRIATTSSVPFDSSFLSKYVAQLNANPNNFNNLTQIEGLITKIQTENAYVPEQVKSAEDLYLTGTISNDFYYSQEGIITNTVNDLGKLVFTPVSAGETTLKVTDSDGNSTLVNVIVDANKIITEQKILLAEVDEVTFLQGESDFRIYKKGTQNYLLPTNLKETFSITSAANLNRYTVKLEGTKYKLTTELLTALELPITAFGFDGDDVALTATLVGKWKANNGKIYLYPIQNGSETIFIGNNDIKTAVSVTTSSNITYNIAKSAKQLSIADDLHLQSADLVTLSPTNALIHLYNDGSTVQAFAENAAAASFVITDADTTTKSIVNVTSSKTDDIVTVDSFEVVKEALTAETGVTVKNISKPIVRAVGLDLYAVGTGSTVVTLSNGKQYNVTVNMANNQYDIEAIEVTNLILNASDLHMTNFSAPPVDAALTSYLIDNNGKLVVTMNMDTTATLTLTSTNNEKTIVHVTRLTDTSTDPETISYTHTVDRVAIVAENLGLGTLTSVVGSAIDILPARAKVNTTDNSIYVYNHEVGNRTFRVTDGTKSTAINVIVSANGTGYTSTPTAVTHTIPNNVTLAADASITSEAAHLKDGVLYATGLGLVNNEATISVPLANSANYVIKLKLNPDTGLYSFDATASVTFNKTINKDALGMDTLKSATSPANSNTSAEIVGNDLSVDITKDTETRIEVTGGIDGTDTTITSYIYLKRDDAGNVLETEVEGQQNALNLANYGYNTTQPAQWSRTGVARAYILSDLNVDFYALGVGTAAYELGTGNNRLFVNVTVSGTGTAKRTVSSNVVENNLGQAATIISGDAVRLSADKKTVYAVKSDTTAILRLADNSIVEYSVTTNEFGHYELKDKVLPGTTFTATSLGLSGTITATGLNTAYATKTEHQDTITLTAVSTGTTALVITDSTGKKAIVNVTVDASNVITVHPVLVKETTVSPTLIHTEDANIIQIVGSKIYAIGQGTAELLVGNSIQQVAIEIDENGHYIISDPKEISTVNYSAADLGFTSTSAMTIEAGYDSDKFYVGLLGDNVIAYSKLTGTATAATEFVVKATDTGLRTLIRLKDLGAALLEHEVAVEDKIITGTVAVKDETIARFKDNKIYAFKTGHTYLTVDNRIQAIDVTRKESDGYLTADVRPLVKAGNAFTAITGTNTDIIEISGDGKTIYAKAIGETTVNDDGTIYKVNVSKDENGKITMNNVAISSQFVEVADAGLSKFTDAQVLYGTPSAISLSLDENTGLTIYSNGATTTQTVAVKVTDGTHHAIINITVNGTGAITKAEVDKKELSDLAFTANETVQTSKARGVWANNKLTIYALDQGNTALKFANGLVNVQTVKSGNLLTAEAQLLQHTFGDTVNTVTNGSLLKTTYTNEAFYATAEGTAIVYAGDKLHSVTISKPENAEQYTFTVSAGVPFTTLDLTVAGGTYAVDNSILKGVKAIIDEDAAENKLVIYKDGIDGVSDIVITTADGQVIYHTTANSTVSPPVLAKGTLTGEMTGVTLLEGTSARIKANDLYYQATGTTTAITTDGRLISIDVSRDTSSNHFTSTPTFVSAQLTEAPVSLANFKIDSVSKLAYALNGSATETFLTANYRTTLTTSKVGSKFEITADERKAVQFDFATYGLTSSIETITNTVPNVASAEVRDGKLVVYAGTGVNTTLLTVKDSAEKTLTFSVTRGEDGSFSVTPQAAFESIKFSDMDLEVTTEVVEGETVTRSILASDFDAEVIGVTETSTGLNITALKTGTTSITLQQSNGIVGLVNVKVETVNGLLKVTSTPVKLDTTGTLLHSTMTVAPRTAAKGTFITSTGSMLFKTGDESASLVRVTKNTATGQYHTETTEHTLRTLTATDLDLTTIKSVAATGTSVGTFIKTDGSELYIYGTNTGVTDLVVSDNLTTGPNNGPNHVLIVANNNTALTATVAQQALAAEDQLSTTWTTSLVEIRDHVIYATQSGKAVATATLDTNVNALMNIVVTRNANQTFAISHNVVAEKLASTVTILDGTSVKAIGDRIFAQKAGLSTIQVGADIFTVTVTKTAEGLFEMEVSDAVVQHTLTAAELGLTSLSTYTINALTGAGVITAQILNDNSLIIYAKNAGQAEITVNGTEGKTIIHTLITDTSTGLQFATPSIAKEDLANASTIIDATNTFRGFGDELFALKPGHIVTAVNDELHNLKATSVNNVLEVTAKRIEKDMGEAPTIAAGDTIIKAIGNTIVAIGIGSTMITVGSDSYHITVNSDGTMQTELLVTEPIDVSAALNSISGDISSTYTTASYTGTEITFTPTAVETGTEIVTVTDGTNSIQIEVTVTESNNTFTVTAKLVSNSYDAGLIGFFPTAINHADGAAAYNTKQGVLKIGSDGIITLYPGEKGTAHIIIKGNNKQALYALVVNEDLTYSFKPLTITIPYSDFAAYPTVADKSGNATAKQGNGGLEVTFVDTDETVFVVHGETGYKTVLVQVAENNGIFEELKSEVSTPIRATGEVTNVVGNLRTYYDGTNTVVYADKNTASTASYTADGQLYKVAVGTDYAVTQTAINLTETNYSTITHLNGDDIVSLKSDMWNAIVEGTGIYRTDNGDYIEVTVDLTAATPILVTPLDKFDLSTKDSSITTVSLMTNTANLYVDGKVIYGSPASSFTVSAISPSGNSLYTGTLAGMTIVSKDILTSLEWTGYASNTLDSANIVRIDAVTKQLIATGKGTQNITFTSENGLTRKLIVTVNDDFELEIDNTTLNVITYTLNTGYHDEIDLTFSLNLDANLDLTTVTGNDTSTSVSVNTKPLISIIKGFGSAHSSSFTMKLPELGETSKTQAFTISILNDVDITITPTSAGTTLQFDRIVD